MEPDSEAVAPAVTLRFRGREEGGDDLHELRAAHVAEVLQGLVGLSSDFAKAGAFGDRLSDSDVLVRPPVEGSFSIQVLTITDVATALGVPTLGQIIWWSTRAMRADVSDFEYLENGNVKVTWQDKTVNEIPVAAWRELDKRKRRRKKQLRQIMAPLSDPEVSSLDVEEPAASDTEDSGGAQTEARILTRSDYDAVRPDDEVEEEQNIFETEAQMSAVNFDDPTNWRIKTPSENRKATLEDQEFLGRIANGLAVRATDIFRLSVREDTVIKNGRTTRTWTVLKVISFRRAAGDTDA